MTEVMTEAMLMAGISAIVNGKQPNRADRKMTGSLSCTCGFCGAESEVCLTWRDEKICAACFTEKKPWKDGGWIN